jgi:hypothetical protein
MGRTMTRPTCCVKRANALLRLRFAPMRHRWGHPMLTIRLAALIGAAPLKSLDEIASSVYRALGVGEIGDEEAHALLEAIHERRARRTRSAPAICPARPRRRPISLDRARSRSRRRQLAASGWIPARIADGFTLGEQAALAVVAQAFLARGVCDLSIGEIAARAGVGETVARGAIRLAQRIGLLAVQERRRRGLPSLTNLVRVVCADWQRWLSRRGGFGKARTAYERSIKKEKSPRAGTREPDRKSKHGVAPTLSYWKTPAVRQGGRSHALVE